jgi:hypothetical protein
MSTSAIPVPAQRLPHALPAQQERVIASISNGASLTAAASQAGVHRNTVNCWRRTNHSFREALALAGYDRAMLHREHAESLASIALDTIREILTDPKASPSVRLKAALAILQTAATPPPEPPFTETLHKNAQIPSGAYGRPQPKTGRNEDCPCGSGLKFKRCCLNKPSNRAILEVDPPISA